MFVKVCLGVFLAGLGNVFVVSRLLLYLFIFWDGCFFFFINWFGLGVVLFVEGFCILVGVIFID